MAESGDIIKYPQRAFPSLMVDRICPVCGHTFKLRLFGINLGLWRKEKCPQCGTWATYSAFGNDGRAKEVQEKDAKNAKGGDQPAPETEDEAMKRRIEESKYE